jgi:hypothetical protein
VKGESILGRLCPQLEEASAGERGLVLGPDAA